ncbi:MAG: transcriptional repressor [Bacteroidales bacterium]|nr:transcriptional repressor [Bacteroidales bacterium]
MERVQNINNELLKAGIKPSYQRMKIYEFLVNNNIHPTVDIIYKKLSKEIPTLSKTTVYNTLKLFENRNLIINVNIEESEIRYDAQKHIHGHFKCESCGKIFDFDYNYNDLKFSGLDDFVLNKTDVMIKGICKECIIKNS